MLKNYYILKLTSISILFLSFIVLYEIVLAYPILIDGAIEPAQDTQVEIGIPASVIITQAIIVSSWGDALIGNANNYFGIKCFQRSDGEWNFGNIAEGCVDALNKEWTGSEYIDVNSKFRKYSSMKDSFRDHGFFFLENSRYKEALRYTNDPNRFAREIHKAGCLLLQHIRIHLLT